MYVGINYWVIYRNNELQTACNLDIYLFQEPTITSLIIVRYQSNYTSRNNVFLQLFLRTPIAGLT